MLYAHNFAKKKEYELRVIMVNTYRNAENILKKIKEIIALN